MDCCDKILGWDALPAWRTALRRAGKTLVVTNGCFDILHAGHVFYLQAARKLGDALLVGLNSDASVRLLKGADRPINSEADRALVLTALECVTAICLFEDQTATRFLERAQPDFYVKGGDYTLETMNQEERRVVEQSGGRVIFVPFLPGKSTTGLIEKIARR